MHLCSIVCVCDGVVYVHVSDWLLLLLLPFYGHYTAQPVLAGTPS